MPTVLTTLPAPALLMTGAFYGAGLSYAGYHFLKRLLSAPTFCVKAGVA